MQIVVLKQQNNKNNYTACIHTLLEETGRRLGYTVQFADELNDVPVAAANTITFIPLSTGSFVTKLIQQQKLAAFISNNKTDLLIQHAGSIIKQKKIPQLLIADDVEQLPAIKKISYSKIFLLTYSQQARQAIADKGFTNIVHVVPFFAGNFFRPITWSMKQQVKIDYAEGTEYFYVPQSFSNINDILHLLKAFTGFKKWQHSSMKIVLTGKLYVPPGDWQERWSTYKYRDDVLLYNELPEAEKVRLLAAAYACIFLPKKDDEALPVLQAMQCHIPVISTAAATIKEYAANAMLAATNKFEDLTQQMILMYKDENMRNQLIENCALQADEFSAEKALAALQAIIV